MSNTFTATPRRLTLIGAILALLGSVSLPSIAQAQQQSGSNLILDTDRNRASGEPRGVITSGGPSADEVKRRLQQRIEEQSEGQITLFGYRQISVKAPDLELGGKPACAVEFEAGIEFQAPGVWASRYRGRPLTFFLIKPFADLSGADNWHPFRIEAKGERFVMQGYAFFIPGENGWAVAGFGQTSRPVRDSDMPDETSAACVNQLKQIGLAIRTWAIDNNDHYPFNVSTNAGGTLELCVRGGDGFDANAAAHFQVMSNELSDARYLVCPADSSKRPASNFVKLRPANISYLLRSGPNVEETHPEEVLARCPIHGNVLLCDGSVKKGPGKESGKATPPPSGSER
jgi:hypothetical protein